MHDPDTIHKVVQIDLPDLVTATGPPFAPGLPDGFEEIIEDDPLANPTYPLLL